LFPAESTAKKLKIKFVASIVKLKDVAPAEQFTEVLPISIVSPDKHYTCIKQV
jgi:hypothetical protein